MTLIIKQVNIWVVRQVICIGTATLDIFVRSGEFMVMPSAQGVVLCEAYGAKLEVEELVWTTGGGATNAAATFCKQGLKVGLISEIGNDIPGRTLINELEQMDIPTDLMVREDDEQTATSIVLVAPEGGRSIVTSRGASKMLEVRDIPWDNLDTEWIYISSLGGQIELLESITFHAKEKGIKVAVNPGAGEIKAGDLISRLAPHWEVLMMNEDESSSLVGMEANDLKVLGRKIQQLGAKNTIVTAGARGAVLLNSDNILFCPPGNGGVLESTGAGDAFGSGFVSGLIRGWDIFKSLQFAQANSVGVISKVGSKAGIIDESIFDQGAHAVIETWE